MRSLLITTLGCALLTGTTTAQATDIGLTMDGGVLTVIYGQDCGPVGCQIFPGGIVGAGESRTLVHYSNHSSLFAIAIGLPGPCTPLPGIENPLLLSSPVILEFSITTTPPFVPLPCNGNQGVGQATLSIPPGAPPGFVFRLQSLGISPSSGNLALGPTIEAITG